MKQEEIEKIEGFKHLHGIFIQSKTVEETKTLISEVARNSRFILTMEKPKELHFSFMVKKNMDSIGSDAKQYPFFHVIMRLTNRQNDTKIDMHAKKMKNPSWNGILVINGVIVHLIIGVLFAMLFYWFWSADISNLINLLAFILVLTVITLAYWKYTEPFRYWLFGLKIPLIDLTRDITARSKIDNENMGMKRQIHPNKVLKDAETLSLNSIGHND